jgi:hypothetical protein
MNNNENQKFNNNDNDNDSVIEPLLYVHFYIIKLTDNYDNWKGSNYFYFNGCFLSGPLGFRPILITGFFTAFPAILFLGFNAAVSVLNFI